MSSPEGGPHEPAQDHHRHRPRPGRRRRHPARAGQPRGLDVLGITAVAGNVPLPLTERNARIICELAGRPDIQVFAGCDAPAGPQARHGRACPRQDRPRRPAAARSRHAAAAPARRRLHHRHAARANPRGTVTLCPLGPLTNIATAFQRAPDIVARVQEIVLMGGGYFEVRQHHPGGRVQHLRRPGSR